MNWPTQRVLKADVSSAKPTSGQMYSVWLMLTLVTIHTPKCKAKVHTTTFEIKYDCICTHLDFLLILLCLTLFGTSQLESPHFLRCPKEERPPKVWIGWSWWCAMHIWRFWREPPHLQVGGNFHLACFWVDSVESLTQPALFIWG